MSPRTRTVIGHRNGNMVGTECALTGRSVREVVLAASLMEAEELDRLLSPSNLMTPQYHGKLHPPEDPATLPRAEES